MDLNTTKHAFITGGASGIGLGIARALLDRGIAVTLADIDEPALSAASTQLGCNSVVLDTRDREGWRRAKALAEDALGPVDILVNNAGIAPNGQEFADMNPESFDRIIAINLTGVFNGVVTFAADMRERKRGYIVNTSSIAGLSPSVPGVGAYSVAKYGVVSMSECLRQELASHGVGVSVLCPGLVATNLPQNTVKLGGELRDAQGKMGDSGVSADDVGEVVVDAIEHDRFYILTHPGMLPGIKKRMQGIEEAFLDFEQRSGQAS